jgi:hypothetical protein
LLERHDKKQDNETQLEFKARRSFFLKIGEFVNTARNEGNERATYLNALIQGKENKIPPTNSPSLGLEYAGKWQTLTASTLHSFSESNTYSLSTSTSNRTITENLTGGEIDEVVGAEKATQALSNLNSQLV